MVVLSVTLVSDTRGGRNPLLVELTSNFADASGVVVPIPVWACAIIQANTRAKDIKYL